jgi:hypothetical protein
MITNHSRTGLRPDKRVIICVAIIFGSTTSPVEATIQSMCHINVLAH